MSKCLLFTIPAQDTRGFFLGSSTLETLVGFLEVKLWWPKTGSLGVSHSQANPHSASSNSFKLLFKCFYQFMALASSATGKLTLAVILFIQSL